jgi:hypothetical protein
MPNQNKSLRPNDSRNLLSDIAHVLRRVADEPIQRDSDLLLLYGLILLHRSRAEIVVNDAPLVAPHFVVWT